MIPLRLKVETDQTIPPFVVRLNSDWSPDHGEDDAFVSDVTTEHIEYSTTKRSFRIFGAERASLERDVLVVLPQQNLAHRVIRGSSIHNYLLVTERCDQLCLMCSQPPKKTHVDMFAYYEHAAALAPQNCVIGVTGGEPTLYKDQLFGFLERSLVRRPDLSFHVLTNGQHFESRDISRLQKFSPRNLQWGIPLYSHIAKTHDAVVVKEGAFARLTESLVHLFKSGASIELRTVLIKENVTELDQLATYIGSHLPFISHWSIMQLERIGFAKNRWRQLFVDHSIDFSPIERALKVAQAKGTNAQLFNFPLCTVPPKYRHLAPASISDWKQRFLPTCSGCELQPRCAGFFEWYDHSMGFEKVGQI